MAFVASKAVQNTTVLLASHEGALRREALRALETALGADGPDYESETIVADERKPLEWCASVASVPFICERRIVIVRNLLRLDPTAEWDAKIKAANHPFVLQLKALPPTAMLILIADDESGDDDKQRRLDSIGKKWAEIVKAGGGVVDASETDKKKVSDEVRNKAKARGKHLTPNAANLLVEMTDGSLTIALAELEKAILYVGDSEAITEATLRAVVAPEQTYNVYQLVDAIVAGDSSNALRHVRVLVGGRKKLENEAFSRIFPTIARQFRLIWQARVCQEANCSAQSPDPRVLALFQSKPRINEERDFVRAKAVRDARRLSLDQIVKIFDEFVTTDSKIKGLAPSFSPVETVEQMVLNMADICRAK